MVVSCETVFLYANGYEWRVQSVVFKSKFSFNARNITVAVFSQMVGTAFGNET